jgi:hypothetical protein
MVAFYPPIGAVVLTEVGESNRNYEKILIRLKKINHPEFMK